jgi:cyclopropane fatty-acyl-phospholipid synthase-like methyltransferase
MAEKEWYRTWFGSEFNQKLQSEENETAAHQFIQRLKNHLRIKPGSQVLEVECGRGLQSRLLANEGFDVTGIDLSFENIEAAKIHENGNLHFYQHDMRLPAWIHYFDYAFNFFSSFGYFATRREHEAAIRTIVKSLKTNGSFVLDYLNVHYAESNLVRNEKKFMDDTAYEIHRWMDDRNFYQKMLITKPAQKDPFEITVEKARLSLGDFTDMLSYQNMQVHEVFGDYNLGRYDVRESPRMIIIGRKTV